MSTHITPGHCCSATVERGLPAVAAGVIVAIFAMLLAAVVVLLRSLVVALCVVGSLGVMLYVAAWALLGQTGGKDAVTGEVMIRSWFK